MVQSGVNLIVGSVDQVEVTPVGGGARLVDEAGEWTEQAHAEFDQENAKFQSERRQAVASGLADAFDETLGAQFAQVVAQLAEAIVLSGEVMASDDACVQLAGGPVVDEPTGMQHRLEDTNDPVVMQLDARYASPTDQRGSRQCGKLASIDGAGQQFSLLGEATLVGSGEFIAQQQEIFEATPYAEVTGVVRAGFVAQDPVTVLIAAHILFGE